MEAELERIGVSPQKYLREARKQAELWGYDPKNITFSNRKGYKLMSLEPKRHFGRVGYADFILWSMADKKEAEQRRERFWARASKIKGDWKSDDYSPNNLALRILW